LLLGYFEFVALLFLPGIAFVELFKLGGELSFAERLGLSFGLGMAVDVLVLAFRTSGLLVGSQLMVGIFPGTLGAMLGASLVAFAASVALRRKVTFYVKPSRIDLYVLGLVALQALLVVAHFSKYPVFPQFQSVDFGQHVQITADLQAGRLTMFPGGLLYYGVHLLMGSAVALTGDIVLEATQYAMGILTAFSPLLVFFAVNSLTQSKRVGLIAELLYVSTGFVWFGSVFDAGLYANFFGILSILLLFALVPAVMKQRRNPGIWAAFLVALVSGYLSHYSFVTIIPALVALPLAILVLEKRVDLAGVAIPAVVIVPGMIGAVLRPDLVGLLVQFVQAQSGGNIAGDTSLSKLLAGWPVLRYIVVEVADDAAAVVALLLAALGVYVAARSKDPRAWMLAVWLLAMLAVAPFTETAWRFSYMALVPLLIVAALGFDYLTPKPDDRAVRQRSKMRARADYRRYRQGLVVFVFLLLVVNSWSWGVVVDAASNGSENGQTQQGIFRAMQWMNANIPSDSQVVSVTSSYYNYYQLLYGRASGYAPLATPDEVAASASSSSTVPTYVVLTRVGTVGAPDPTQNPFNLYPNDARFHLQYNDSGVLVFKLGA
jgi:hypothetical protein